MRQPVSVEGSSEHVPGGRDIWFFVLFESLVFTSYFCVYLFNRTQHEQAFLLGQSHLLLWLGVLDTIVLLTSSWAVARCVQHARAGRYDACDAARHSSPLDSGVVFLVLKIVEWVRLIHSGHTFTSSEFFQYYFFLTAIHCVHLLIGFVVLGVLMYQLSGRQTAFSSDSGDLRDVLAHRRLLLGTDLRPALRGEVMVESGFNKRLFGVWLILVAISLAYLGFDHAGHASGDSDREHRGHRGRHLLGVDQGADHHARVHGGTERAPMLRRLTDFWVLLMAVALVGVYFAGKAVA